MAYPTLNEQLKQFPVYVLFRGQLVKTEKIRSIYDYSHYFWQVHHYIREQMYYKNPDRYEQMLILLPRGLHQDLHSAMSDERFYDKWHVERENLMYRRRKV